MKILFSKRCWAALPMFAVLAVTFVSAAVAGNAYGHSRRWRSDGGEPTRVVRVSVAPRAFGGVSFAYDDRQYGRGDACARPVAVVNHPPHRWFDGRLYCGGQNPDGSWRSIYRCEDDYGRKKVNLPGWDPRCEPQPPCP